MLLPLQIVSTADANISPEASVEERNAQLSKLININPRTSIPHPEWTLLHDAILTRAVTKHGWIESGSTISAIGKDKTIRWGAPFEVPEGKKDQAVSEEADPVAEKKFQVEYTELHGTASRAVKFLQELKEKFVDGSGMPAPTTNEVSSCIQIVIPLHLIS